MNGILVIDKPSDMTSARVVAHVKKALRAKKAGHTGTLDPFATGVLVCCINKATRLAQFLTCGKKRYNGLMRLGIRTDTQDLKGHIISSEPWGRVTDQDVHRVFRTFLDMKYQNPPAYSALKQSGVRLYELARQGTFVRKPSRRIHIYELEVTEIALPDVRFDVVCSAGTYIRTLCADIGDALGCGAHLTELCRTESGHFTLAEAISLEAVERLSTMQKISDYVVPMNLALRGMPGLLANNELIEKIRHGQPVTQEELPSVEEGTCPWIKVTDVRGNLVAVMSSQREQGIYSYACVFPDHHS